MERQSGDSYIRDLASFIRTNERNLAESGLVRRRRGNTRSPSSSPSSFLPLGWLSPGLSSISAPKPLLLSTDPHHLFYVLMRLEALGLDIGPLDVHVQSPSRPTSYANIYPEQKDTDVLSLASFRSSFSMVSKISLGGSWWNPEAPIDVELKYIYSSFTKLPAISISAPGNKAVIELIDQSPDQNAVPLDIFKNLERLECDNIDPRILLGWNRLSDSLKSLKIKKSGLEDMSEVFIKAVLDDQARRQGSSSRQYRPFTSSSLPSIVNEDEIHTDEEIIADDRFLPSTRLSLSKWTSLRHLYLPDNGLTFFPSDLLPYLTSLTHLDLSSNLLVSVPTGFGELYNLLSLNLADNLIDSVLGIYLNLGQILSLNLSRNRLESLCGLERLLALERIDLRHNLLEETSEISRLAVLPNITELWVDGNPLVEIEGAYRIICFDYFWREGKVISLDGNQPTLLERRSLTPSERSISSSLPASSSSSTPIITIEPSRNQATPLHSERPQRSSSAGLSSIAQEGPVNVRSGDRRSRKPKRIVDLYESQYDAVSSAHLRGNSTQQDTPTIPLEQLEADSTSVRSDDTTAHNSASAILPQVSMLPNFALDSEQRDLMPPSRHSRHSRYQTEYGVASAPLTPSTDFTSPDQRKSPPFSSAHVRSNTLVSRSEARRARISASVFEAVPSNAEVREQEDVDAYRKTIESLKKDMGDSWLKVFTQGQSS